MSWRNTISQTLHEKYDDRGAPSHPTPTAAQPADSIPRHDTCNLSRLASHLNQQASDALQTQRPRNSSLPQSHSPQTALFPKPPLDRKDHTHSHGS